ncbi:MAG: hypothetical protein HYV07_22365 [Deltaproteobacteria bacterium]|nr:hypothetical protein [Deltaproteobacteria bacterium]
MKRDRGFALIVVVLLIVVMSVMGISLLQLIQLDLALVGNSRQNFRVREISDGVTDEMLGSGQLQDNLPTSDTSGTATPGPVWTGYSAAGSEFISPANGGGSFRATARYLRPKDVTDTDQGLAAKLVLEIDALGSLAASPDEPSAATKRLVMETYKIQIKPKNWSPAPVYGR